MSPAKLPLNQGAVFELAQDCQQFLVTTSLLGHDVISIWVKVP
ncbi:hypothetical protein C942_02689 [Photobacterium marinum]|uniref:Uncharacterized protein n=1 Tax=Photobacterium marinum TaxID=1056511 RepID=L8JEA7_9GAMM|nr:hypothetical protein C942_02689 [Photobacterium marinum]